MNERIILPFFFSAIFVVLFSCKVANNSTVKDEGGAINTGETINVDVPDTLAIPSMEKKRVYREEETKIFDLVHTKLEVSFDWQKKHLLGTATLQLKPYFYPQTSLKLDAKGFDIHKVSLVASRGKSPLEYTYDDSILSIQLDKEYTRNDDVFVEIKYTAKPYEMVAGGSEAISSDQGLYFINADSSELSKPQQIWTQGETEASSHWFPTIDAPNQRTTQEMYITVDENFSTLSNGLLIYSQLNDDGTRTDYWNMEKSHAPYLFMMAIGKFAIVTDKWEGIDVSYYVEPEYEQYARAIFGNTPEMLSFFSEKLGYPYPWSKYSQVVVRDFVSGAMENTTASTFMEALQVTDRELLDENWDKIIAHELFHHWFGDLLTSESWANLPLNEAFANYSEYLWVEHKYGIAEADFNGLDELNKYLNEAQEKQVDLIRFYYDDREDMFDSHSYAKGGRILHMLRKYVGDDAFFASLHHYLKQHEYSDVEVHDLRLAFEEVTGEDLNWFFNQWFLASGHPILSVEQQYADGVLRLTVEQLQDSELSPIYKLPLYVDIYHSDTKERFAVVIDEESEAFEFRIPNKPSLVDFDAEKQLLGEISYDKSIDELAFQYQNSEKFLAKYEAINYLAVDTTQNKIAQTVLKEALGDSFWAIRQEAVNAFSDYKGEDATGVVNSIAEISKNDEKSLVRADALAALASIDADKYTPAFVSGIQDPSYAVVGAALYGYGQTSARDKMQKFKAHENIDNINILIPVADFYALEGSGEQFEWFKKAIESNDGVELYYLLQYLGQYLMNMPVEFQEEGFKILKEYAQKNETYYIRLAAFQGLLLIEELEGVRDFINMLKVEEKDSRLLDIYQNY